MLYKCNYIRCELSVISVILKYLIRLKIGSCPEKLVSHIHLSCRKMNIKFILDSMANSQAPIHPIYVYIYNELPLIETAEPVSSFVLIHLRRSSSFSRATCFLLKARVPFLHAKSAFRVDNHRLNRTPRVEPDTRRSRYFANNFCNNNITHNYLIYYVFCSISIFLLEI